VELGEVPTQREWLVTTVVRAQNFIGREENNRIGTEWSSKEVEKVCAKWDIGESRSKLDK
jgi:hypothetical protein